MKSLPQIAALGSQPEPSGTGQHVPDIENLIREVKKILRCVNAGQPHEPTYSITRGFVQGAETIINSYPNELSSDSASALEILRGRRLDFKRDLRVPMGAFVRKITRGSLKRSRSPKTSPTKNDRLGPNFHKKMTVSNTFRLENKTR